MPMRPNLLASRRTPSSIAKHSGHLNKSKSHGSLRWGLFDQRHSPDTCPRSVPRLRHAFLPNTSSSYIPIVTSQSKRNFSNSTRKQGIWDDDDEVPEPKPVQRIPGRPAFVRPTRHRDLGSLVRSRVDRKNRVAQRLRIEKEFNSLPSHQELVEGFIQLKYKHVDDLLDESLKANLAYESEYSALSSIFQKRIKDVVSRITKQVLRAEKTTQECVAELEGLSSFISAHLVTVVSDSTKKVLQAEKITQKYIAEVIHLSSSILGLDRIQAAVTKAENTGRMIDHDFCCNVFGRTPEWERKLELSAEKIHGWKKSLRATQKTLLPALVDISGLSICRLRDNLDNDYLRPRNTTRSRIDKVLHESEVIQKIYNELKLKRRNAQIFPVRDLCLELQKSSNLHPDDKMVFGQYKEILAHSERELSVCAHYHRAYWLRRQEALHPLRRSELWNLKDVMAAASSARSYKATDKQVLLALALGARKDSPESRYLHKNSLTISNKINLEYKRLWMPKPARSPELNIYWRQLDVMAPLMMTDVLMWGLQNEGWYLHHSLKGDLGTLWTWVPEETMEQTVPKIADWCIKFQKHRSELRQMISEYRHLNWLRLESETLLHSMGQRVYLAGKFEVLNPMSQDVRAFKKWTARMGQLTSDAYIPLMAIRQTRTDWQFIHDKINRRTGRASSFIPHLLELGSSTNKTWRKNGREESESPKAKAAFMKLSQSRLSRYMKGKLSGHSESSPASQGNQEPDQAMIPTKGSLGRIRQILKRKAGLQHAAELVTNQGSQDDSGLGHNLSPNPSTIKAEDHTTVDTLVSNPLPADAPAGQDNQQDSQLIYKPSLKPWGRKSSLEAPEPNPFLVNAPARQTNQEARRIIHKPSLKLQMTQYRSLNAPEPNPFLFNAPASQTSQEARRVMYKPSLKPRGRKWSLKAPEPNPFLANAPARQTNQEARRVIDKPSLKPQRTKYRSVNAPEPNPFLVNAPASQTSQEGSQVLPKPPPIPSKSKEVSLSSEPHLDDLHRPILRDASNASPSTRTHNGLRPATMLPRKPFPRPDPNRGRKYSTDATSHQTQFRQTGGVSDDSLSKRSIETDISSVPDTTTGHQTGSIEEDDHSRDEPIPSSTPQFWSHSSQHSPDGRKLIVHYCRTLQSTEEAVQHFFGSKVIGFDMEWKAQASGWDSIQSNVSVIQIANEERIAIFQVALFKPARSLEDLVSPSLRRLIESPDVMKVGVSIKADCTRLRKYLGIDAKATFELSHLYKLIKYGKDNPKLVNKRGVNLSEQINEHFGLPLEKSDDVRCGDWTRALSYRQVQYAATDPYACVRLFHTMDAKRQAMNPMPPRPAFAELNQPIVLPLGQAVNSEEDPVV
ncbi:hypothetical protein N7536_006341 [Penicillium majusculum]|uniref:3'-5' exonuclease domain-containing protein n=1 Tax=Penicillium solitum TaxID=60172 RepID=A0A1V6RQV9_9EURO|nr:uncharacterized protein PENSOL_c001G02776 [Penicillium solitum]KAJ5695929.1 hypothetical protein N7536_006341 [Penicillium majusculum]OQE04161.1 hypothetical protein PENSOL_c001G02776 [Penicillium solitum]